MKKWITAEELMAKLETDPEFVARRAERDEEFRRREAELRREEAPLVTELREAGFAVDSAWDFVPMKTPYPEAVPILLQHLARPYSGAVKEGIARALAVPEARYAWHELVRIYRQEDTDHKRAKDGLAVAVAGAADEVVIGELIALARDTSQGSSRVLLLNALERSKDPRSLAALMSLGDDPDLTKEIQVILRRKKKRTKR